MSSLSSEGTVYRENAPIADVRYHITDNRSRGLPDTGNLVVIDGDIDDTLTDGYTLQLADGRKRGFFLDSHRTVARQLAEEVRVRSADWLPVVFVGDWYA